MALKQLKKLWNTKKKKKKTQTPKGMSRAGAVAAIYSRVTN
jgi:hypothetical protein